MKEQTSNGTENNRLENLVQAFEQSAQFTEKLLHQLESLGSNLNKIKELLSPIEKLDSTLKDNTSFFENTKTLGSDLEDWYLEVAKYQEQLGSWQDKYIEISLNVGDQIEVSSNLLEKYHNELSEKHQLLSESIERLIKQTSDLKVNESLTSVSALITDLTERNQNIWKKLSLYQKSFGALATVYKELPLSLRESSDTLKQTHQYIDIFSDKMTNLFRENTQKLSSAIDENLSEVRKTIDQVSTEHQHILADINKTFSINFNVISEQNKRIIQSEDLFKKELKQNQLLLEGFEIFFADLRTKNIETQKSFEEILGNWADKNLDQLPHQKRQKRYQLFKDIVIIALLSALLAGVYFDYHLPARISNANLTMGAETSQDQLNPNTAQIRIFNGCGIEGLSGNIANFLKSRGLNIVEIANWQNFDQQNTQIIAGDAKLVTVFSIAEILKLPKDSIMLKQDFADEIWIVLGKDSKNFLK